MILKNVAGMASRNQMLKCINSGVYTEICNGDHEFTTKCIACFFNLEGLVEPEVPECLELTKLDLIVSLGPWFTTVHVDTGRDDSISCVPVGKKINHDCQARESLSYARSTNDFHESYFAYAVKASAKSIQKQSLVLFHSSA